MVSHVLVETKLALRVSLSTRLRATFAQVLQSWLETWSCALLAFGPEAYLLRPIELNIQTVFVNR